EADLLDAEAGEDAREPRDFLEAEERRLRQEPVARAEYFARHAVHAAEIAAVGDGDAQVAQPPAARVDRRAAGEGRCRLARARRPRLEKNNLLCHAYIARKIIAERGIVRRI